MQKEQRTVQEMFKYVVSEKGEKLFWDQCIANWINKHSQSGSGIILEIRIYNLSSR